MCRLLRPLRFGSRLTMLTSCCCLNANILVIVVLVTSTLFSNLHAGEGSSFVVLSPGRWHSEPLKWEDIAGCKCEARPSHVVLVSWDGIDRSGIPLCFSVVDTAPSLLFHTSGIAKPNDGRESSRLPVVIDTAEKSQQFPDGRIVFVPGDAQRAGQVKRQMLTPEFDLLVFPTGPSSSITWDYTATRWGKYDIVVTYSNAADRPVPITIRTGDQVISGQLQPTGGKGEFCSDIFGSLHWEADGKQSIVVANEQTTGDGAIELRALLLNPACEGSKPAQADDRSLLLHARDATVHGTNLRWEPNPKKQTLGYWSNPSDYVTWDFDLSHPGAFSVEILQGCGTDAGGSVVAFQWSRLDDPASLHTLRHTVVDTGHWQNFQPFRIGELELSSSGKYRLTVRAESKPGVAVMDLRQVRLVPR